MKIWLRGQWYDLPNDILIVRLTGQDKKNIANMKSDCDLYCEYDNKIFSTKMIVKLLERLKK